ncbi:hypothetical protein ACTPD5_22410, partial [Clostridioides difficile]|uniref:hypothetical protein n=1 Tax=Clostridioides difficile TaxID=1496 RepID=UPI003F8D6ACC
HGKKLGIYKEDVDMGVSTICIMSIFLEKNELNMKIDFRYPKGSKNPIPVSISALPEPSIFNSTKICVSRVFLSTFQILIPISP